MLALKGLLTCSLVIWECSTAAYTPEGFPQALCLLSQALAGQGRFPISGIPLEREPQLHTKAPALRKDILLLREREGDTKWKKLFSIICSLLYQTHILNNLKKHYSK